VVRAPVVGERIAAQVSAKECSEHLKVAGCKAGGRVCEVDVMVKLLRACVWMPRRNQAKKDVVSCDKLREAANRL
jgi:hypothetical protein